jgi:GAF domain-containing protein
MQALLDRIVATAIAHLPHATCAGITLVSRNRAETPAASAQLVDEVDRAQYAANEGPCLSASRRQQTVHTTDLTSEQRWPTFAARAVTLGIRAILSVPLFVVHEDRGAVNFYSVDPDAFDDADEKLASLLGTHAGIAMTARRAQNNFEIALDSRDLIGQAKGILMERHRINSQQAFDMLVWSSQHRHRKLRDIARNLAETGEL